MGNNVIKQEGRLKIVLILDTTNCNLECKKWYRLSYLQNSNRDTENKCKDTKEGRGWGGRNREIGIDLYTLLILCIKRN